MIDMTLKDTTTTTTTDVFNELEFEDLSVAAAAAELSQAENGGSIGSRDALEMTRMGKKPVLKRNFGFMSILGFSCTVLITWEGIAVTYMQSFLNGGPAGVIFGFLIVFVGTLSTFVSISELASIAPIAGGQYHWVALLAPRRWRKILSYITAWVTFAGWQALVASSGYLIGTLIQALIIFTNPTYTPTAWQAMLLFWAVIFFGVFVNTIARQALARFEGLVLVLHIFGFLAVLVPLVYLGPHDTLSFFVGLSGAVFSLLGADSAVHMAEEIKDASIVIPRALLTGILINGCLGFGMVLALMYCMGDPSAMINAQSTVIYPFIEVFGQAVQSISGATIMAAIIITVGTAGTVGALASASRMLWSFARDRGFPLWRFMIRLDSRTAIPVYAIGMTTTISVLLSLITLGSALGFQDLVSLTVSGLYASYLLCCTLLLYRRLAGDIKPYSETNDKRISPDNLAWGRWNVPGVWGVANNTFSCVYLLTVWFFSFWPPQTPVTPQTMNFSSLIFGSVLIFSLVWYMVDARKSYSGPVVEV